MSGEVDAAQMEALMREQSDVRIAVHAVMARLDNMPRDAEDWQAIANTLSEAARLARRHVKARS